MSDTPEVVVKAAKAMRRRRFERTRRLNAYDELVPPTDNELDDARAAIEAMRGPLSEHAEEMIADAFHEATNSKRAAYNARHAHRPEAPSYRPCPADWLQAVIDAYLDAALGKDK